MSKLAMSSNNGAAITTSDSRSAKILKFTKKSLKARRTRLCLYTTTALGLLFCVVIPVAVCLISKNTSYTIPLTGGETDGQIHLAGQVVDVNIATRTLTMEWYLLGSRELCQPSPLNADIFVDRNLLDYSSPGLGNDDSMVSNDILQAPSLRFNGTIWCSNPRHPHENAIRFRSIFKLNDKFGATNPRASPLYYPYDTYFAQVYMYAVNPETNANVSMVVEQTWGVVMDLDIELSDQSVENTINGGMFYIINISRSRAVKLAVVVLVVSCWAASIAFLGICIACVIYQSEEIVKDLLVLPIAALFSFLQIRTVLPGSPPSFGSMIDFYGILPNLVIISITSVVVLIVVLYRRSKYDDDSQTVEKKKNLRKTDDTSQELGNLEA
ncbi:hypothetical protein FRC17_006694, partial [Serendipita sp. 399]